MVKREWHLLLCGVLVLVLLAACGETEEQDPAAVVRAFYEAANAEDIDAFLALVAEDAQIEWGRQGLVTGKAEIRRQAEALFRDLDFTFTLSDIQVEGKQVTFKHVMVMDGTGAVVEECIDEAIVEGGKIVSDRMVSCEYP
jgi:ketosteroid isomerase-like protein